MRFGHVLDPGGAPVRGVGRQPTTCTWNADRRIGPIDLTKDLIARSRVIAKGARIRDVQRLVEQYGGKRSKWVKKSSPVFEIEGALFEYHWYEHHGIGRIETRLKAV